MSINLYSQLNLVFIINLPTSLDKYVAAIVTLAVVMLLILLIIAIITFQRTKGRIGTSMEMHVCNLRIITD